MNIGSTIKKLRRAKDMTQETLAEYLGVSVSAVSQWEADKTSPDLSLIPTICNLLDISADELLGVNTASKEKKIREIIERAASFDRRGYTTEAHEILTRGLHQFPDSFAIMESLMTNSFIRMLDGSVTTKEGREEARDEAIRLGERILEKSLDDSERHSAIQTLCLIYPQMGKTDLAVELAERMPFMATSREFLLSHIHSGRKGYQSSRNLIDNLIQFLSNRMVSYETRDNGEFYYTDDDRAVLRNKQIDFLALMFETGDYGFYHCHLSAAHTEQAKYYASKNDEANTLSHLRKAAEHAIGFINFANKHKDYVYTSLLFREYDRSTGSFTTGSTNNDAAILLAHMEESFCDFVRHTAEFNAVAESLKPYAGKWEPDNTTN